jgi:hypothetical protein
MTRPGRHRVAIHHIHPGVLLRPPRLRRLDHIAVPPGCARCPAGSRLGGRARLRRITLRHPVCGQRKLGDRLRDMRPAQLAQALAGTPHGPGLRSRRAGTGSPGAWPPVLAGAARQPRTTTSRWPIWSATSWPYWTAARSRAPTSWGPAWARWSPRNWPSGIPNGLTAWCWPASQPGWPYGYPMPRSSLQRLTAGGQLAGRGRAARPGGERAVTGDRAGHPELADRIARNQAARSIDQAAWQALARAGATYSGGARQSCILAPTLVACGDADSVIDPRNSKLLASRIPDARMVRFPSRTSSLLGSPGRFTQVVMSFLLRHDDIRTDAASDPA